jgi:hypothetical protein
MIDETTIGRAVRAVAGFGLDCEPNNPVEVDENTWPEFKSRLVAERLTGLAVAAAEGGKLMISDDQFTELTAAHREVMLWALDLERTLLGLAEAFDDAGIEFVVLKGPALAHSSYPDPSWRPFMDIDLLVRTSDWRRSCALLAELGLRRRLVEPRPGFDERFGKAACHVNDKKQEIDLHRTLVLGPFGLWMEPDELFDRTASFELGNRTLRRLDETALLAHACVHASLGMRQSLLISFRDVAQAAESPSVRWDSILDWAARWKLRPVLRNAFKRTADGFGMGWPTVLNPLLESEPSKSERMVIGAYTGDRRSRGGTAITTLRALSGPRSKAAYIRNLCFPSSDFVKARNGSNSRLSYLRRWAIPIHWALGRRSR